MVSKLDKLSEVEVRTRDLIKKPENKEEFKHCASGKEARWLLR